MKRLIPLFTAMTTSLLSPANAWCQKTPAEARQFDFWIGDWDLHSRQRVDRNRDEWKEEKCVNRISSILGGRVIQENFDGSTLSAPMRGMSVSVYDPSSKQWKQTWVDDQGSYLDFAGGFKDGKMILSRTATVKGRKVLQRMVFEDITRDKLTWKWESSADEGKSWLLLWELRYQRRPSEAKEVR